MAVKSISSDYTDRKKDISLFQYPDASITGSQTMFVGFGNITRTCTGIQKLAQKYAIILTTNVGSQANFTTFGTPFLYTLQAGISPIDKLAAAQIFNLASYDAVRTLKTYQTRNSGLPADEKIASAKLLNITLQGSTVSFDVLITTEAGSSVDFVIPLPK